RRAGRRRGGGKQVNALTISIPRLPVGDAFEAAINGMRQSLGGLFDFIGLVIRTCVDALYGLFAETSATQFTLLAAAVIAGGLIVRGKYRPTLIAGGVWLVLYVAELVGGVAAAIITSLPPVLFTPAMNLFGAEHAYPPLVLALLLLAALTSEERRVGKVVR